MGQKIALPRGRADRVPLLLPAAGVVQWLLRNSGRLPT